MSKKIRDRSLTIIICMNNSNLALAKFPNSAYTGPALGLTEKIVQYILSLSPTEGKYALNAIRSLEYIGATLKGDEMCKARELFNTDFRERITVRQPSIIISSETVGSVTDDTENYVKIDIVKNRIDFNVIKSYDLKDWQNFYDIRADELPYYSGELHLTDITFTSFSMFKDMMMEFLIKYELVFRDNYKVYKCL